MRVLYTLSPPHAYDTGATQTDAGGVSPGVLGGDTVEFVVSFLAIGLRRVLRVRPCKLLVVDKRDDDCGVARLVDTILIVALLRNGSEV